MVPKAEVPISRAIAAVGELLAEAGEGVSVVIVGGAAMVAQGFVTRATDDVDVIAVIRAGGSGSIEPPDPIPTSLAWAIARVARDFNLPENWMNTLAGLQWNTGLPPGFEDRIHWRQYGGLRLGLADRYDLIMLKLYAAADSEGPSSIHFQDLLALGPTHAELDEAAAWARTEDTSPGFSKILDQVVERAKRDV